LKDATASLEEKLAKVLELENQMSTLTADLQAQNASLEERNKAVEEHLAHRSKLEQDLDEARATAEQHKQARDETHSRYLESSTKAS
jgi:chromosome segregation ATPase